MSKPKLVPQIRADISNIIKQTIYLDDLPREYKIGFGFLLKELISYMIKSPLVNKKTPHWLVSDRAKKVREWKEAGLITATQLVDILHYENKKNEL